MTCPCGTARALAACCGRFLDGKERAGTAEALMRSRYSAYVLGRVLYLHETWDPRTRPRTIELDASTRWLGLTIVATDTRDADHGTVEFIARYHRGGVAKALHERSRFEKRRGAWRYVDGDVLDG